MADDFFPQRPEIKPQIYAYADTNPCYAGLLKVGYTAVDVAKRVAQQYPAKRPDEAPPYRIVCAESAVKNDGASFTDRDVHRLLRKKGFQNPNKSEWFQCSAAEVKACVLALRSGAENGENRSLDFEMRPEQEAAVNKTAEYFAAFRAENPDKTPHFLWNAKMRFGKTFAAYQLAKRMNWKKLLVLTFKPAVQSAWEEDLKTHIDFTGWQFVSRGGLPYTECDKTKPVVCFGSFQDYLGKGANGGIKPRNEWVHATNWDCVILDEYHYGAWREKAKDLFTEDDEEKFGEYEQEIKGTAQEYFDENYMPITTFAYLYLSGTPFRAIASGEFIEEQIYNWTYSDEQAAKNKWKEPPDNPYAELPRMVMMTYQLPPAIRDIALRGEFDEFDLNSFFAAEGRGKQACFTHKDEVQKWLNWIRGAFLETATDELKLGAEKPPLPFSHAPLVKILAHTFWFLPSVASCHAMKALLSEPQNRFFRGYGIIVAAGAETGTGVNALPPIREAMGDPLNTRTITLSCGKLTAGVSVKPWQGIFMLCNTSSPETYFQAAFRVQTPWVIHNPDSVSPHKKEIIKKECYIFDFAPDRALRQIADYSCRLNTEEQNPEQKVAEFIRFLPVLAYDGSSMKQIDAAGVLDMALSGTTATLLARRWESALLVNVDNETLTRLTNSAEAMNALMNIEGFRNLNQDIETIVNKSEAVQKTRKGAGYRELSQKEKRELSEAEKEFKSKRKLIQQKLIKFATRIPVFMYLTDYRERRLLDVITQLEPGLFKRVTGLRQKDFELLVSLGLFNSALMNDAVFKFKQYEDASLVYTGVDKHEGEYIGGWDTVLSGAEFRETFKNMPQ
jgi:hypothetical protein